MEKCNTLKRVGYVSVTYICNMHPIGIIHTRQSFSFFYIVFFSRSLNSSEGKTRKKNTFAKEENSKKEAIKTSLYTWLNNRNWMCPFTLPPICSIIKNEKCATYFIFVKRQWVFFSNIYFCMLCKARCLNANHIFFLNTSKYESSGNSHTKVLVLSSNFFSKLQVFKLFI